MLTLASCGGGGDAKLLPGTTAREITENLGRVREYAAEGECVGAADAATEVSAQVEALQDVDPKLKQALQRGAEKLGEAVASCEEEAEGEEETIEDETTKPERHEPPGQEKKAEREREREEQAPEKDEAEAEEEETPGKGPPAEKPPAPPGEGGGTPAPGGVSPGQPAEPGAE